VSPDDQRSHQRFRKKLDLPFHLLVDTDHRVATSYGAWVEKSMYGIKRMGIERSTFVIGRDGRLARIFRKVKASGHARDVRDAVAELAG
jgi:thioredoxin-dependent peroxiredoxin